VVEAEGPAVSGPNGIPVGGRIVRAHQIDDQMAAADVP